MHFIIWFGIALSVFLSMLDFLQYLLLFNQHDVDPLAQLELNLFLLTIFYLRQPH